jgi:hypothetical protein
MLAGEPVSFLLQPFTKTIYLIVQSDTRALNKERGPSVDLFGSTSKSGHNGNVTLRHRGAGSDLWPRSSVGSFRLRVAGSVREGVRPCGRLFGEDTSLGRAGYLLRAITESGSMSYVQIWIREESANNMTLTPEMTFSDIVRRGDHWRCSVCCLYYSNLWENSRCGWSTHWFSVEHAKLSKLFTVEIQPILKCPGIPKLWVHPQLPQLLWPAFLTPPGSR